MAGCEPATISPETREFNQPTLHNYENELTKRRVKNLIEVCGVASKCDTSRPLRRAKKEEICRVHTADYYDSLKSDCSGDAGDYAHYGAGSKYIAELAAGSAIDAVEQILDPKTQTKSGYLLCRPPGHHAESNRGMGFCLFNNVAVAAQHAIANKLAKRVAVVDYDVHHGNGTEEIFYGREDVLVIGIHEDGLYPLKSGGTGNIGKNRGEGFNVNVPLPPGCGDGAYQHVIEKIVGPLLENFKPDLILVSSGFDASTHDPLGHMMVTSGQFGKMAKAILSHSVPTLFCHEGGYSEVTTPFCGLRVVEALLGIDPEDSNVEDPSEIEAIEHPHRKLQSWQESVIDNVWEGVVKNTLSKLS